MRKDKEQITIKFLALFGSDRGQNFISGQSLAKRAGISRSAVWKHICRLRKYGYEIDSIRGLGYRLVNDTQAPVPWKLQERLKNCTVANEIVYMESAISTQITALSIANKRPEANGVVVIAEKQTGGRGRLKRKWLSPEGGLWLSILLRPRIAMPSITVVPFVAALAVRDAIEEETGLDTRLKWPNDVMISGRKVAGILLDVSAEADSINYAVFGIGINANLDASALIPRIPDSQGVTSLRSELGHNVNRLELTVSILEKLEYYLNLLTAEGKYVIISTWKKHADMLGRKITIMQVNEAAKKGIAIDVDADGSLIVEVQPGGNIKVNSGDISVRY